MYRLNVQGFDVHILLYEFHIHFFSFHPFFVLFTALLLNQGESIQLFLLFLLIRVFLG